MVTAFLLSFLAGISTMLGTFLIFFKDDRGVIVKNSLSLAAGVMLCVSFTSLIPESLVLLFKENKACTFIMVLFLVLMGILLSFVIDKKLPEFGEKGDSKLYKIGIFSMFAIILHNIPEGVATFLSTSQNITLGITLSLAIALHNIPEGISISVPIYKASGSRKKALLYTFISGMSEPLGAVLAYLFLMPIINDQLMGILFSLIAGIMIHIAFLKLLPAALSYKKRRTTILFFILGIIIMYISQLFV